MSEASAPTAVTTERLGDWYQEMLRIRVFEEKVQELFLRNLVQGTTHLCQGQEAVSVGVSAALTPDDYVTMTYRGHGQALARGMDMEAIFAELMGKRTGVSMGLGGSMHLTDKDLNLIGCFAIVGAGLPVAVGAAMSAKLRGDGRVSVTFFGDGATNIGTFHEALNMASVWGSTPRCGRRPPSTTWPSGPGHSASQGWWWMAMTWRRSTPRRARPSIGPGAAQGRPCSNARPIATAATREPTRANTVRTMR